MQSIHLRADHGVSLHCTIWEPEQEPKGIVQIIHGVAEHTERYDTFARFLNQHGYLVVGEDHPGHGKTADVDSLGYMTGGWLHVAYATHPLRPFSFRGLPLTRNSMLSPSLSMVTLENTKAILHTSHPHAVSLGKFKISIHTDIILDLCANRFEIGGCRLIAKPRRLAIIIPHVRFAVTARTF